MNERRSERRSLCVGNAAQTRPDQTRVVLTVSWGVSIKACIHRQGSDRAADRTDAWALRAEIRGGF